MGTRSSSRAQRGERRGNSARARRVWLCAAPRRASPRVCNINQVQWRVRSAEVMSNRVRRGTISTLNQLHYGCGLRLRRASRGSAKCSGPGLGGAARRGASRRQLQLQGAPAHYS